MERCSDLQIEEEEVPTGWSSIDWIETSDVLRSGLPVSSRVLLYLMRYADKNLASFHSKSKIGKALGVSRVHVQNELAELEKLGIVERHPDARNGKVRLKRIVTPRVTTSHPPGDYDSHPTGDTKKTDKKTSKKKVSALQADTKKHKVCEWCSKTFTPTDSHTGVEWTNRMCSHECATSQYLARLEKVKPNQSAGKPSCSRCERPGWTRTPDGPRLCDVHA